MADEHRYMSFIYGLMYALLAAYPVVFQGKHGMNLGVGSLPFIGLIVGEFFGGIYILIVQQSYIKKLAANNDIPVPEWRLPPCIVGGCAFTIGLFWYVLSARATDASNRPQVWMDRLDEEHSLDGTDRIRSLHWVRHLCDLPAVLQLPD